jgi:predicted amidophosphoribosyltransferase
MPVANPTNIERCEGCNAQAQPGKKYCRKCEKSKKKAFMYAA